MILVNKNKECQAELIYHLQSQIPATGIHYPTLFNSCRYTMPKMVLKQESRLNGVKTNITNLNDVA